MRTTSLVAVVVVTAVACAGAFLLASRSTAAPPAGVRAWEYKVIYGVEIARMGGQPAEKGGHQVTPGLNSLGADGWELVVVENAQNEAAKYYFKRPK